MHTFFKKIVIIYTASLFLTGWKQVAAQQLPASSGAFISAGAAREHIYAHLDKEVYTAGELVWFKIYATHPATHVPTQLSKVSYVEIIDPANKPVAQAKIEMHDDGGDGSFYLPLNLLTGSYTVRAYTNLTRRRGGPSIFEKTIFIINTVKNLPPVSPTADVKSTIDFFPEGGQLVNGLETVVAFHIRDASGKGVTGSGIVTDSKGDTVAVFSTTAQGRGRFRFTPVAGNSYTGSVQVNGNTISHPLPKALPAGVVMQLDQQTDGNLIVSVSGNGASNDEPGQNITLVLHDGSQTLAAFQAFLVYGKKHRFTVEKHKLIAGVNHFALFDSKKQPVAERLYFVSPKIEEPLRITTSQPAFGLRMPVTLNVNFRTDASDTLLLSASVFRFDSLKNLSTGNIVTTSWLTANLHGEVEDPSFYLSDTPGAKDAADLLMLTNGWRSFSLPSASDLPVEYNGHTVIARVTDDTEKPAPNMTCYLTVPSSPPGLYIARSDAHGYVRFNVQKYYGPGDIIIQPVPEDRRNYKVYIQTPFSTEPVHGAVRSFRISKDHEQALLQKNLAMQAQNIYLGDSIRRFSVPLFSDTLAFYGKPEFNYWLEDYKQFTTMEEVLREYVAPINVVLKNGGQHLRIYDELNKKLFEDYMLVMLDGVPLKNPNKIFSYDPLKIRRIQVVPRSYLYGAAYFTGIASFESYNGKFDGFELDPSIVAIDYEGLQLKRQFYSPSYSNPNVISSRIPDMRTTLQWLPDVKLISNTPQAITFYTSDIPGSYVVIAEGVSKKGKLVSVMGSFEVK